VNINSINHAIRHDFCESFLSSFSSTQKKVMIVALGIFSAVALAYYFYRFYNFKANPLIADETSQPADDKASQKILPAEESAIETEELDVEPPEDLSESPKNMESENNFSTILEDGRTQKVLRDGVIEIGEFQGGKLEGEGLRLFPDEYILGAAELEKMDPYPKGHKGIKQLKGTFKEGKLHGEGEILFFNGAVYTGTFANNFLIQGRKEYSKVSGSKINYESGTFENDKLHGKGKICLKDKKVIQGIFEAGIQIEEKEIDYQIFIKTMHGSMLTLVTSFDTTIADIKKEMLKKLGVAIDQQRLIFAGRQLEDHQTLEELKIKKESTMQLLLRASGD
jgi:large subunit ribosomal protein L40e